MGSLSVSRFQDCFMISSRIRMDSVSVPGPGWVQDWLQVGYRADMGLALGLGFLRFKV